MATVDIYALYGCLKSVIWKELGTSTLGELQEMVKCDICDSMILFNSFNYSVFSKGQS